MNKCINNVIINDTPIEEAHKDISIDIDDLIINLGRTCQYCKYSEPLYDEGQLCTRFDISLNDNDYCSYFEEIK